MDLNVLRGALLIALIIGFVGIFIWAWSKKRKPDFDAAARMPLENDDIVPADDTAERDTNRGAA